MFCTWWPKTTYAEVNADTASIHCLFSALFSFDQEKVLQMEEYHLNITSYPSPTINHYICNFLHRDGVTNDPWYAAEISNLDTPEIMTAIHNFIKRMQGIYYQKHIMSCCDIFPNFLDLWFAIVNSIHLGTKTSKKDSLQQSSVKAQGINTKYTNTVFQFTDAQTKNYIKEQHSLAI